MSNELDYMMNGKKAIISDLEKTQVSRLSYARSGIPEAIGHFIDQGIKYSAKMIYDITKTYINSDIEESAISSIEMSLELFKFIHNERIHKWGKKVSERIEPAFIDFLRAYPDKKRALLTRDVSQVANYVIGAMKKSSVPYDEYIFNHAVINELGIFTGELRCCTSMGILEKNGTAKKWNGKPVIGPQQKLEAYKYLLYTLDIEPGECLYVQDNDGHEKYINEFNEENGGTSMTIDDLKEYKSSGYI